jgi:carbon storage regulator
MLVLSRKPEEAILIGDEIEVCVTRIDGDTVKLGIKAPQSVRIYRREVLDQIRESNQAAAVVSPKGALGGNGQAMKAPDIARSAKNLLERLGS